MAGWRLESGHGGEQLSRVRVGRCPQHVGGGAALDDRPVVEHDQLVAEVPDDAEVVGDQHERQPEVADERAQQVEDLDPHGHVERAHRLVADEQARARGDGAGDGDALLLPAGELVRIAPADRRRQPDLFEHLVDAPVVILVDVAGRRAVRG